MKIHNCALLFWTIITLLYDLVDTRQAYFYGFPTYMVENKSDVLVPAESIEGGIGRGENGQVSV